MANKQGKCSMFFIKEKNTKTIVRDQFPLKKYQGLEVNNTQC